MELTAKFEDAQSRVKGLSKAPSNDDLLELYALYKQATAGDVSGSRPGIEIALRQIGAQKIEQFLAVDGLLAVHRGDGDLPSEAHHLVRHGHGDEHVGAVALEHLVRRHVDGHVQITGLTAG